MQTNSEDGADGSYLLLVRKQVYPVDIKGDT